MKGRMQEQIERVKNHGITVEEIVREKLALLEQNKACNAVVCYDEAAVLAQARELDKKIKAGDAAGRLCGAVITVKDNLEVKGLKATAAMKKYENYISVKDSEVVVKLRNEGAVILGKTNMPAGAMDMQTYNEVYGRTNHPEFPDYTCGGSSGGGAAAVKLGISDGDIGNDFMGSIRVPSHFCGIYGMIGTDKVIPLDNMIGGKPYGSTMSNILRVGIQASSFDDLSILFTVLAQQDKIFPAAQRQANLKIAYTKNSGGLHLSKEYGSCYLSYIKQLSEKYEVKEIGDKEFNFQKAREVFLRLLYGNIGLSLPLPARIVMGSKMSIKLMDYLKAEEMRDQCIGQLDNVFREYNVLLSPVTATAAFPHKYPKRVLGNQAVYEDFNIDGEKVSYSEANMGYTTPFSLTANPVIVVPIGKNDNGIPLGVQIVGRRRHEADLLQCAKELINSEI